MTKPIAATKPKAKPKSKKVSQVVLDCNKVITGAKRATTAFRRASDYHQTALNELSEAMKIASNVGAISQESFENFNATKDELSTAQVGELIEQLTKDALYKKTVR